MIKELEAICTMCSLNKIIMKKKLIMLKIMFKQGHKRHTLLNIIR